MKKARFIGTKVIVIMLCVLLSGCAQDAGLEYIIPSTMESTNTGTVAKNDKYTLLWDDTKKCVLLSDNATQQIWATTPYEYFLGEDTNLSLNSPLYIQYFDFTDGSLQVAKAYACIEEDTVSSQKLEDGIKVTFYFQEAEVTVSVLFVLREDSLQVSVNTRDIEESGKTQLISISLTPYLCSSENRQDRSSYLFIPSGSGALMYTDKELESNSRIFSQEVYGNDRARVLLDHPADEEPIRMPVFGVKKDDRALCGIIEKGAEAARIETDAGNRRNGYSTVYATFYVRGYDYLERVLGNERSDATIYAKTIPNDTEFTVGYYPLNKEKAGYVGMAECYRTYLLKTNGLEKSSIGQQPYHITLLGAAQTKQFLLGVPYMSLYPLTTWEQAQFIVSDLINQTKQKPHAVLKGFGQTGVDVGQIAGGFGFASKLGGEKKRQHIEEYCRKENIPLFTDFEIVYFKKSGYGFDATFNVAKTANLQAAAFRPLKKNVRVEDKSLPKVKLLQRSQLVKAMSKLLKTMNNKVSGLSFSSLAAIAYSDYNTPLYYVKGGMADQVQSLLKTTKQSGHALSLSAANSYGAGIADSVINTPLQNGGYETLDETVPFYQIVFHGYTSLYSEPLNLALNADKLLLRAIEAGVSPSFTLSYSYDISLADSNNSSFYGMLYDNHKTEIFRTVQATSDYYQRIQNAQIVNHEILAENLRKTTFDNGVCVYVNYGDRDITVDGLLIKSQSYAYQ